MHTCVWRVYMCVRETKGLVGQGKALHFTLCEQGRHWRVWRHTWWECVHVSSPSSDGQQKREGKVTIFYHLLIVPFSIHTGSRP